MVVGGRGLTSLAPSPPANEGTGLSKAAVGNFFTHHLSQKTLGFKPGNFSHDARLGSGGEAHLAPDDVAVNDSVECENFLSGFRVH